jgi:hypothetical protein
MTQTFAEILILIPSTLHAGLVFFVACVLQPIMNKLDEATFGHFVALLYRQATTSVYEVASSTITFVAMIPYLIFYGFHHWWFIAGLFCFLLASTVGKMVKLPVYKKVTAIDSSGKATIDSGEKAALAEERRKLQAGNWLHALSCLVYLVLMVIQFSY